MLVCYTAMAPTLNYTLSLHDALPILSARSWTRKVEISPEKSSSGQGERAMVFSDWSLIEDGTSSVCVVPTGSPATYSELVPASPSRTLVREYQRSACRF